MSRSFRQDAIRDVLERAEGEAVPLPALLLRIYGHTDTASEAAFRSTLNRLRDARPDLEIEYVGGYRLKRDGQARDRDGDGRVGRVPGDCMCEGGSHARNLR